MTSSLSSSTFTWKNDSSFGEIPAHIYYDGAPSASPRPTAIIFHAGGFVLGSTDMIPKRQVARLVEKGFVVIAPEYRLCPQVSLYDGPIQDAKDVLKWCQDELPQLLSAKGVEIDAKRIVAMGHSAGGTLALTTGLCPSPPLAILDLYGCKYFSDPAWSTPLPRFAKIPDQPEDFTSRIFSDPHAFTSEPMFTARGPNLSDARCAWYIQQCKQGTSLSSIVHDKDYARVDATTQFGGEFPPTYFLHGTTDVFVSHELSVRAHEALKKSGVETELVLAEGLDHAFDLHIGAEDKEDLFGKFVEPAFEWLRKHV